MVKIKLNKKRLNKRYRQNKQVKRYRRNRQDKRYKQDKRHRQDKIYRQDKRHRQDQRHRGYKRKTKLNKEKILNELVKKSKLSKSNILNKLSKLSLLSKTIDTYIEDKKMKIKINKKDDKLLTNLFLNKNSFKLLFDINMRKKRIKDIYELSKFYSKHHFFEQNKDYNMNSKLVKKWIASHKTDEDKRYASMLLKPIVYVSFDKFKLNLIKSVNRFNTYLSKNKIKKYYIIIGANSSLGSNEQYYLDIGKSNFWTLLMILPYLTIKPYDILMNLAQGIEYSLFEKINNNIINDFVFIDDACYSGSQLFKQSISYQLLQKTYFNNILKKKNNKLNNNDTNKLIKVSNHIPSINIHIIVPYMSIKSRDIALNIQYKYNVLFHLHNSYFINDYANYYCYRETELNNITIAYKKYGFNPKLIPLYFSHKMPDGVSTLDYILLSGIISNYSDVIKRKKQNKPKFVQFIDNCIYPKNKIMDPTKLGGKYGINLLCPISPYKIAKILINDYIKRLESL